MLKDLLEELNAKVAFDLDSEIVTIEKPSGTMELNFYGKLGNAIITRNTEIFTEMFRGVPFNKILFLIVGLGVVIGLIKDKVSYEEYPDSNRAVIRFKNEVY